MKSRFNRRQFVISMSRVMAASSLAPVVFAGSEGDPLFRISLAQWSLHRALRAGEIAGAGVDVFTEEPPPADHPLLADDIPNLVLTPHLGASTPEAQREIAIEIARAMRDALLEGNLRNAVNVPSAGTADLERLRALGVPAAITGKALLDGKISTAEVNSFLQSA